MASILRRPILVGGVALSLLLWLWQSLDELAGQVDDVAILSAIALGGLLLLNKKTVKNTPIQLDVSLIERATVEKAIATSENSIAILDTEAPNHDVTAKLRDKLAEITAELDRRNLNLTITGGKGVGKTSLLQILQSNWKSPVNRAITTEETPALFSTSENGLAAEKDALAAAVDSDLVIFITNADLTETEFQTLKQLKEANQKSILVFNKEDRYLPEERELVLQRIQERVEGILEKEDAIAIATSPKAIVVRQHQTDGSVQEWLEESVPEISALTDRLGQILTQQSQQLVWANCWRSAINLQAETKSVLNQIRRDKALPQIEQYQWIAAATAFANPLPALDLVATGAINAQLVLDLSGIYRQKFSIEQAQTVAATMGSLILKLGLVELSTQTITTILKSNTITFVAGGLAQGISAAYFTRIAGLSLIEYFQAQEESSAEARPLNLEKLRQSITKVFQENQRTAFWQSFVQQTAGRLLPASQEGLGARV